MFYITEIRLAGGRDHQHIAEVKWKDGVTGDVYQSSPSADARWRDDLLALPQY